MIKEPYYVYLGTNGTITSPVHLEDIYYIPYYQLVADEGCSLTKDDKNFTKKVMIPAGELEEWKEIVKK